MLEGKTCADKSRLNVRHTSLIPNIGFEFKSFRYDGDIASKEADKSQ